jgi:hypothetical protein
MVSNKVFLIVTWIFAILIIIAYIMALYYFQQYNSKADSMSVIPYCVRTACTDGTQIPAYNLTTSQDPIRRSFQKNTFCILNSFPCGLIANLQTCKSPGDGGVSDDDIKLLAHFYNEKFMPSCAYSWGNGIITATASKETEKSGPNDPNYVNGPNDPGLVALLSCAKNRKITSDDINALQKYIK